MSLLSIVGGLSPDNIQYQKQQNNLGRYLDNVGHTQTELITNLDYTKKHNKKIEDQTYYPQENEYDQASKYSPKNNIDLNPDATAKDNINPDSIEMFWNPLHHNHINLLEKPESMIIKKGERPKMLTIAGTSYTISITPEKYSKDMHRGSVILRNEQTRKMIQLDKITVDLNRFGRLYANNELNTLANQGVEIMRIDSISINNKTVTITGKMEVTDGEKKQGNNQNSIESYSFTLDRKVFNKLFDDTVFQDSNTQLHLESHEIINDNLHLLLEQKFGGFTRIANKLINQGVSNINVHFTVPKDNNPENNVHSVTTPAHE